MGRKKKEGERLPDSLHGLESRWVVDKGFKIAPPLPLPPRRLN